MRDTEGSDLVPSVVLVGNKMDLNDQREVSTAEGADLAKAWSKVIGVEVAHMEASAKDKAACDEIFAQIIRDVRANREAATGQGKKKGKKPKGGGRQNCAIL